MKRLITILGILSLVLSMGLVYLGIKARTSGVTIFNNKYIINSKLFGEPEEIRFWITPSNPAIQEKANEFRNDSQLIEVTKAYNWLETNYHYDLDDWVVLNNGKLILKGGSDFWSIPIFTLAQKEQNNGNVYLDCEDGSFLLVSILRALGIDAYANIGTVTINDSIYGHAWGTVNLDGKEYLLETTLGEPLTELKSVPSFYKMFIKFNEKDVIAITGADINKEIFPPLPPAKIQELKKALGD